MVSLDDAKRIIKEKGKPYSCADLPYGFVFCMSKDGFDYFIVDKRTGKISPFSPGLDLVGYSNSRKFLV